MAELKRVFSKAIMNKDMDERLVPNGQHRDALNIQIATSDGSNVGSVQTLKGNTLKNTMESSSGFYGVNTRSTCVGSIASADRDKIYYFVDASSKSNVSGYNNTQKDYILEHDTAKDTHKYVFVDIHNVKVTIASATTASNAFLYIPDLGSATINKTGVRIGMSVTGTLGDNTYTAEDGITVKDIVYDTGNSRWKIQMVKHSGYDLTSENAVFTPPSGVDASDVVHFVSNRVLNFNKDVVITGINILDEFIYWTDNQHEPKKVNIARSIAGTGGTAYLTNAGVGGAAAATNAINQVFIGDTDHFHTRLVREKSRFVDSSSMEVVTSINGREAVYVQESDITVIKKGPTQRLELDMLRTNPKRINSQGVENPALVEWSQAFPELSEEEVLDVDFGNGNQVDFRKGDILLIRLVDPQNPQTQSNFTDYDVRAQVVESNVLEADNLFSSGFKLDILSKKSTVTTETAEYVARLDDVNPLFEFKLPRFSYRYKYQDGEYSTFAPWSEVAFLTDDYEYEPTKGYNHGMVNQLRSLTLKNYHASKDIIPGDVTEIDLLYKETNNPTVYTVKTIRRTDAHPAWPDFVQDPNARGEYTLTTDMIHAVVPSNQLLRPWDNVPRKALAQEISANRLIYGNYLQNYTVTKDPIVKIASIQKSIPSGSHAYPSVKSSRTYQAGVVFSDGYGRETPVLTHENSSIHIPKSACGDWNRLKYSLSTDSDIPGWAKYYSFYVKETSVEYHTMAMDRWYDAWDGNIWLSFPSSDRNKVDEETFIILKKQHGNDSPVTDDARYKVLSIENEAPDYIKTVAKSFGVVPGGGPTTWTIGSTGGAGWPYPGVSAITMNQQAFETAVGSTFLDSTKEGLTVKLRSADQQTAEYPVSSVVLSGTDYKVTLEEPLSDDVGFAAPTGESSSRISDLFIEFIGHKVENRPEFDGRFFVKIYKDQELENNVLTLSNPEAEMVVTSSYDIGYLNNNALGGDNVSNGVSSTTHYSVYSSNNTVLNPNKLTASSRVDVGDENNNTYTDYEKHPTEHGYHRSHSDGEYEWIGEGYVSNNAIVESPLNLNTDSQDFWDVVGDKEVFFIDAASTWSLTGYKNNFPGRFGGQFDESWWTGIMTGSKKAAESEGGLDQADDNGTNNSSTFSNAIKSRGLSGRGIWDAPNVDNASIMDISWSGMGSGWRDELVGGGQGLNDGNLIYGEVHQMLGLVPDGGKNGGDDDTSYNDNVSYSTAWEFIQKLTTTGTKFKFSSDPESVEYTVLSSVVPQAYASGSGIVNLNGWGDSTYWKDGSNKTDGHWGIRNFSSNSGDGSNGNVQWRGSNLRQRWSVMVTPEIGGGDASASGYNPVAGTLPPTAGGPSYDDANYKRALHHDLSDTTQIQILEPYYNTSGSAGGGGNFVKNPSVWETEPKESVDLDIYYQVSGLIPLELNSKTNEEFLPIGSTFSAKWSTGFGYDTHTITKWITDRTFNFTPDLGVSGNSIDSTDLSDSGPLTGVHKFKKNGSSRNLVTAVINGSENMPSPGAYTTGGEMTIYGGSETTQDIQKLFSQDHTLDWNNCWSFGNGVESDRIRDDFNAPQMDNGVKASSVIETQAREERRKHGLIWSGIYNSNAGVNNTNQFIMAESITKDINPVHGSVQSLLNKDTRLIIFCEDKILRAVTNKDALYNADGKPQLVASNAVIGDVQSYQGDYGISKNPESMVTTPYRTYFTDVNRNQVLSLSTEGIRSISDLGMRDYFADIMKSDVWRTLGTYDPNKAEYNLTISKKYGRSQIEPHEQVTVSFSEGSNGWVSFKSFYPQSGVGINNSYYTFFNGQLYKHHSNELRNNFYDTQYKSDITVLFNDSPNTVKNFATINYEGTQAKVTAFTELDSVQYFNNDYSSGGGITSTNDVYDGEYFNLSDKTGWYLENMVTNLQTCSVVEFKDKEGKWFGTPAGEAMGGGDESLLINNKGDYTAQGVGLASIQHSDASYNHPITITVEKSSTFNWDTDATISTEAGLISCTTGTLSVSSGAQIAQGGETVELTVSPVGNYPLHAEHLLIDGATAVGNVYTNDTSDTSDTFVGTTASYANQEDIDTITFSDNGTPGDPGNTVKVIVKFKSGGGWPVDPATYYIDIDIKSNTPTQPVRKSCLSVTYNFYDTDHQVAPEYADISDITESELTAGGTTNAEQGPTNRHTGTVPGDSTTEIATYTFARAGTSYYTPCDVKWHNLGPYEDYYSHSIDSTYDEGGLHIGFVVHLYYSPPQTNALISDPEDFCSLNHKAIIVYSVIQPEAPSTGTNGILSKWDMKRDSFPPQGGSRTFTLLGIGTNVPYTIKLERKANISSTVAASTNGYYDWDLEKFQTEETDDLQGQITSVHGTGQVSHSFEIPSYTSNQRYEIQVGTGPNADGVSSEFSTDSDGVIDFNGPINWGDQTGVMYQYGVASLTFEVGNDTDGHFTFAAPTIKRSKGKSTIAKRYKQYRNGVKGAHSTGATRVTLNKIPRYVEPGMYIINPFEQRDTGVSGVAPIQHKTKVTKVFNNVVTLDKALQAPLADNGNILFVADNSSVIPFEITANRVGSRTFSGVATGTSWKDTIAGTKKIKILTNGVANNTNSVTLDNTKGVLAGMKVGGAGVVGSTNSGFTNVLSVTNSTRILLTTNETIGGDVSLTFERGDTSFGATSGMEPGLEILHVQASRTDAVSGVIQGYIRFSRIDEDITLPIHVGDIFVTA